MSFLILLPLLFMSSCSTNSGGPATIGEAANMVLIAPAILPIAAIHYSIPVDGDKRLRKMSVRGKWYKSPRRYPGQAIY